MIPDIFQIVFNSELAPIGIRSGSPVQVSIFHLSRQAYNPIGANCVLRKRSI